MTFSSFQFSISFKTLQHCCLALLVALISACSVYKPDVTQGNIITAEQVAELKLGMSRQQVSQILGSPLLQDVFNSNRWDYVYRFLKGNGALEQRVMTLFFDPAGKLERWSGLVAPEQNQITLKPAAPLVAVNQAPVAPDTNVHLNSDIIALNTRQATNVVPVAVANIAPAISPAIPPKPVVAPAIVANPTVNPTVITSTVTPVTTSAVTSNPAVVAATPVRSSPLLSPDINVIIANKVEAWRFAWASKHIGNYASHYANDYKGDFPNHSTWLAQRKRVIEAAGDISITLSDIKVIQTSNTEARAAFTQAYQSSRLTETGTKNLYFQRIGEQWHIVAERFIKQS